MKYNPMKLTKAAKSWINNNSNTDVVIFSPEDKSIKIPDQQTTFKWIAAAKKIKLPAYKQPEIITGEFMKDGDLPKTNTATVIKSVSEDDELDIKQVDFANGMRLLLKKYTAPAGSTKEITLNGYRPGGVYNYSGKRSQ